MGKKKYAELVGEVRFESSAKHFPMVPRMVFARFGRVISTVWEMGYHKFFISPGTVEPDQDSEYLGQMKEPLREDGSVKWEFSLVFPSAIPKYKDKKIVVSGDGYFSVLCKIVALRRGHMEKIMPAHLSMYPIVADVFAPCDYFPAVPYMVWAVDGLAVDTVWEVGCGRLILNQGVAKPEKDTYEELGKYYFDNQNGVWKFEYNMLTSTIKDEPEVLTIRHENLPDLIGVVVAMRHNDRDKLKKL